MLYILTVAGLLLVDIALFVYFQTVEDFNGNLEYPYRDGQYIFLFLGIGLLVYGAVYILTRKNSKP